MAIQTWILSRIGNWFDPANWTTGQVPVPGDRAVINAGTAMVARPQPGPFAVVAGVSILLGGLDTGESVTLEAVDAVFQDSGGTPEFDTVLTVSGGEPTRSPLNATFLAEGRTSFDGQILVSALAGGLTIDSEPDSRGTAGNFTFNNADQKAVMVVGQESVLTFKGQTITNQGLIEVLGGSDIAAGVTFTGPGIVALESGGQMTIAGNVVGTGDITTSPKIDFADGTGSITLTNTGGFSGIFGFVSTVSPTRRRTASSSSNRWPRRSWPRPAPSCRSRASCRTPSARPHRGLPASRWCPASRSTTPASTPATGARPTSRRLGW